MNDASLLRVVLSLLLVIAAILCSAWLARRSGLLTRSAGGALKNVGTLALGPRNHVAIVQVEQTWLVLGVSSSQVTLLHTLPAPAHAPASGAPEAQAGPFAEKLARVLKRDR
ncbi:flagellar biosynthetic protein FliO [Orrella sp. JC864]|uniref:flagellar biosynthetic protein FliO n=1 Tax=Orrella sp. JC864 TaxID=3120298 RepID=UPI00300A881D